ncbi:hypothetical protein SCT_2396 [Sulfuricella sp. T08]|uniref:hypothetical protein n=1 Tax=Sulfuricella sp. T08 TaxID=1632857 RepID=UPI000617972C|nr:hypothetical protein [Sulfuricella sp. T08]GAO36981.1 hypothetical protein SCT_2396 [Sulfuricella sp. T08]
MKRSAIRELLPRRMDRGNHPPGNHPTPRQDAPDSISFHPGYACSDQIDGSNSIDPARQEVKAAPKEALNKFLNL